MPDHARYFRLTCLTPVHVGTGEQYAGGIDFVSESGKTWLLDAPRVLQTLQARGSLPRDTGDLSARVAQLTKGRAAQFALAQCAGTIADKMAVRAAIRCGNGRPMLPGSSIKGALRSLLFAARLGQAGPHRGLRSDLAAPLKHCAASAAPRSRGAAGRLEELVFRSSVRDDLKLKAADARADLLRMCSIADAVFERDCAALVITAAVGTERNTAVGLEVLGEGSSSVVQMSRELSYSQSMFNELLPSFESMARWSRIHAQHLIETDLRYFGRLTGTPARDCTRVIERLQDLGRRFHNAGDDTIFLRLGWGTGWRTMTGDPPLEEQSRLHLLPKSSTLGPKTRKVIVSDASRSGPATGVLGWISLTPISSEEAARLLPGIPVPRGQAPVPAAITPTAPAQTGDPFLQAVATVQSRDWGRLPDYYHRALSDPANRDSRLAALGAQVAQVWRNDRRRLREAAARFPELAPYLARRQ
jgi:CRISPR-associated protein Csm5